MRIPKPDERNYASETRLREPKAKKCCAILYGALALTLLLAPGAAGQGLSLGVAGGVYPTKDFIEHTIPRSPFPPDVVRSDTGGWLAGGSIEIHFTGKVSVTVDGLYRLLKYERSATYTQGPDGSWEVIGYAPAPVVTWQFPVLLRYKFWSWRVNPFLEGGPAFRTAGNLNSSNPSHVGVSAGAGLEFRWGRFALTPSARYTRWAREDKLGIVYTRPDQVEFLLRASWKIWGK